MLILKSVRFIKVFLTDDSQKEVFMYEATKGN